MPHILTSKITLAVVGVLVLLMAGSLVVITPPATKRAILTPRNGTHTPTAVATTPFPTAKVTRTPVPKKGPTPQPTAPITRPVIKPTPAPPVSPLIAQDTFRRPDMASFWGTASDGQTWDADANRSDAFSLLQGQGIVQGTGVYTGLLGPTIMNTSALTTGSLAAFDGESNIGIVLRWTNEGTWYKAYIDGSQLIILKSVEGTITTLASAPFPTPDAIAYSIRFQAIGPLLQVRVWPASIPEPSSWLLSTHDSDLQQGHIGLRLFLTQNVATIDFFSAKRM